MRTSITSFYPKSCDVVLGNRRTHTYLHTSVDRFLQQSPTNCLFFLLSYSCLIFSSKNRNKSCRHTHRNNKWPDLISTTRHTKVCAQSRKYLFTQKNGKTNCHWKMSELDSVRSILYSKSIDSANVKPYTGLHFNTSGNNKQWFFVYIF
jgi:hypothetical protein